MNVFFLILFLSTQFLYRFLADKPEVDSKSTSLVSGLLLEMFCCTSSSLTWNSNTRPLKDKGNVLQSFRGKKEHNLLLTNFKLLFVVSFSS